LFTIPSPLRKLRADTRSKKLQKGQSVANTQSIRNAKRLEDGKSLVRDYVMAATSAMQESQSARAEAKLAVDRYKEEKAQELEAATKRFGLLQKIEYVVGALVLVQIAIFVLRGEPYIVELIFSTTACLIIYVIIAILDSKAKSAKLDIEHQIIAAKKIKFKNNETETGIIVEFD
jgi:hypothetical protein